MTILWSFSRPRQHRNPWVKTSRCEVGTDLFDMHHIFLIWVWVDTYRYILVGWTSIYQLFWGSLGTRVLTHPHIFTIFTSLKNQVIIKTKRSQSSGHPLQQPEAYLRHQYHQSMPEIHKGHGSLCFSSRVSPQIAVVIGCYGFESIIPYITG